MKLRGIIITIGGIGCISLEREHLFALLAFENRRCREAISPLSSWQCITAVLANTAAAVSAAVSAAVAAVAAVSFVRSLVRSRLTLTLWASNADGQL